MKNFLALTIALLVSSVAFAAIDAKQITDVAFKHVANQANASTSLYSNLDESRTNSETTPALVASLDSNFYQISDYRNVSSNNPMKFGLLGAAILIGFITHRRMNVNNS